MRYLFVALTVFCLTSSSAYGQPVSVRLPVEIRVTNSRHPATVTTPTGYQIAGHVLQSIISGPNSPVIYELNLCSGCRPNDYTYDYDYSSRSSKSKWIESDGWIQFRNGKNKVWQCMIDPKGLVGNLYLVSAVDRTYRQQVCGPRWRFDVPNRPGGPISEEYYLVLEYQGEDQQRIFTFIVENSAPPELDGLR